MDLEAFHQNNSKNFFVESSGELDCASEECVLGIDEAGRGPVLGPMVYAAAYCTLTDKDSIKEQGFADSKVLNEESRDKLFELINGSKQIGYVSEIISPCSISQNMMKRCKYSLNEVSHDSAIGLIRKVLQKGVKLVEVYVDTVGVAEKYQKKLSDLFPDIDFTVASKADATYPIVSAASICAKVIRDACVKNWNFTEPVDGKEWGSGYPNDPATKKFLANNLDHVFGFPQFVRFSWSTAEKIMEEKGAGVVWDEEEGKGDAKTPSVSQYFKAKKAKPKSHAYFVERKLSHPEDL